MISDLGDVTNHKWRYQSTETWCIFPPRAKRTMAPISQIWRVGYPRRRNLLRQSWYYWGSIMAILIGKASHPDNCAIAFTCGTL